MVIKEGYKQTEIGIIPNDWVIKTISEFTTPVRGGSPRPAGDPKYFNGNFIPWLTVASLTNIPISQIFVSETENYLTEAGSFLSRILDKETLIIANSGATLGVAKLLSIKCCANDGIAALLDFDKNISKFYVVYFINTKIKYLREVVATGNGQPNLNTDLIGKIQIPLPPTLTEQTAIATALSDVDGLITGLEKLIAKKRNIKQGAMQQLLQPKEGWEVKKLGDVITNFQNGYGFSAIGYVKSGIPIITMAQIGLDGSFNFDESKVNFWKPEDFSMLKNFHIKNGDLIIAMTDVTPEKNLIGRMAIVKTNRTLLLNQRVGLLRLDDTKVNAYFLKTLSNMRVWRTYCIGSASLGVQANIGTKDILNGELSLPNINEQNKIAETLYDMDTEITALEQKLEKYKKVKLGMMQELLTGKTRLV